MEFLIKESTQKCTWSLGQDPENSPHNKIDWQGYKKVFDNILETVGHTPLIKLNKIPAHAGINCSMYAKCEFYNPGATNKDRFGVRAIMEAERTGLLTPGLSKIVVPTIGNTGIGVALAAAVKDYPCTIIAGEDIPESRETELHALGAKIFKLPTIDDSQSKEKMYAVVEDMQKKDPFLYCIDPLKNPENALCHYDSTAEEILDAFNGQIDMLVMTARSGGVLTGIGRKMREKCPECRIICVDEKAASESENCEMDKKVSDSFEYQSDSGVLPPMIDSSIVDKWVINLDKIESTIMARKLLSEEGLLCGYFSGVTVHAAIQEAKHLDPDKVCVVILADGIRDYLNTFVLDSWMQANMVLPCTNPDPELWWWDKSIDELKLRPVQTCENTMDCHKAIHIMKKNNIEQLPIVDVNNLIVGMVTLRDVLLAIVAGDIHSTDPITKAKSKDYQTIEKKSTSSIGLVVRMLENYPYVVVIAYKNSEVGMDQAVLGIIKPSDILQYIEANNPNKV